MDGAPELPGGKIAGVPARWVVIVVAGGALGLLARHFLGAKSAAPTIDDTTLNGQAPYSYTPVGGGAGTAAPGSSSSTPASTEPVDNLAWSRRAIALLITNGIDPGIADSAIRAYLNGDQLNAGQSAAVKLALTLAGIPPEYVPPPLYYVAPVSPPQNSPTPIVTTPVAPPAPPPPAPVPAPPAARSYTVVPGDSLWKIAARFYGDGAQWRRIYAANVGVIGPNPNLIHPGQVLVIP